MIEKLILVGWESGYEVVEVLKAVSGGIWMTFFMFTAKKDDDEAVTIQAIIEHFPGWRVGARTMEV